MRLTLRTMLAYLDEILEPEDAAELGKKIEASEFAASLVHRIRGSVGRLRLGAPALDAKGLGDDANTVAEYLDNTMAADRVPEFEKTCLESEMHLAEVTACHQVLTLVLGEPADVAPSLRQRIYGIGAPGDSDSPEAAPSGEPAAAPAHGGTTPAAPDAPDVVAPPMVARSKPEIPDYLRTPSAPPRRSRSWAIFAVTAVAAFLLAGLVILAMGPLDASHPLASLLGVQKVDPPPTTPTLPTPESPVTGDQQPPDLPVTETTDDTSPPGEEPAAGLGQPEETGQTPAIDEPIPPVDPVGTVTPQMPVTPPVDVPTEPSVDVPTEPSAPSTPVERVLPEITEGDTTPMPPPVAEVDPAGDTSTDEPVAELPSTEEEPATDPADSVDVGRYTSDLQQVLTRWDENTSSWQALAARSPLAAGDRLLVLPTYRPQISLANGVQLTAAGPSLMQLAALDDQETPGVTIEYGRAVIVPVGKVGARFRLLCGQRQLAATFGDAESALAVEVRQVRRPGTNPEETGAHLVIEAIATSGHILWAEEGQDEIRIEAGQRRTVVDREMGWTTSAEALPDWIDGRDVSDIDRRASTTLYDFLQTERPVDLTLNERAEDRREEVRSLAVRSLAHLGQFDPLTAALRDQDQRSSWPVHFEALQAALARGPAAAGLVREALEKVHSGQANELFTMLWGYSPQDLEEGADAQLVARLNHESLDFRVLAFENLRRITGASLLYRPEFSETRRRSHVMRWQEQLKNKEIRYKSPPQDLPTPLGEPLLDEPGPA